MKRTVIICAMFAAMSAASAQTVASNNSKIPAGSSNETTVKHENEYGTTVMAVNNGKITFAGLPEMNKPTWAVITDKNGETIKQTKVTPAESTIDVSSLQKGMYFVTLTNRNVSKKAFVLNL